MCDMCADLDEKISHYRRVVELMQDQMARETLTDLIKKLAEHKAKLHPREQE